MPLRGLIVKKNVTAQDFSGNVVPEVYSQDNFPVRIPFLLHYYVLRHN